MAISKKMKWTLIVVGVIGVSVALKYTVFKKDEREKVTAEGVVKRTIVETVNASGKVYPEVEVKISPDISGEITELNVAEGDSVRKGQVLARIYADIYALQRDEAASRVNQSSASVENNKAQLDALRASVDQAKATFDRNKKLFDDKVISRAELEQYETTLRSANANFSAAQQSLRGLQAGVKGSEVSLSRANKDLGRTTLTAPMDGVVSSLKVKRGERVAGNSFSIGTEMMTVADMSVLEVRVDVGENDIVKISIGDSADVTVDAYSNRIFKGVVTKIASSTKSGSQTSNDVTNYEVRIRLDKSSYADLATRTFPFRPGMNATADIKTRTVENVLSVPITAVNARVKGSDQSVESKKTENESAKGADANAASSESVAADQLEEVVFVLQADGTVKKFVVRSGIQDMNHIEILSGLKLGDKVITAPYAAISKTLKDGDKVNVVKKEELFTNK